MDALSVLFVPSCTERVAATRVRIHQFLPHLRASGIRATVIPIVSDAATRDMIASPTFSPIRRLLHYARVSAEKFCRTPLVMIEAARHRVVFLQRTTFFPGAERILKFINPNIIFDFDDSIFMADPDSVSGGWLDRVKDWMKRAEFERVIRASRLVIANNDFLREQAACFNDRVIVLHEAIDTVRHSFIEHPPRETTTIGWIGSPSTAKYLAIVEPALRRISQSHRMRFKVVGAGAYRCSGVAVESVPWTLETEAREVQSFDIGIMPQPQSLWAEGKWGTKLLQYHAVGIPCVASYSRANSQLLRDGLDGFFATREDEWVERLAALISDPALRQRMGRAGRQRVEAEHSVSVRQVEFVAVLRGLIS